MIHIRGNPKSVSGYVLCLRLRSRFYLSSSHVCPGFAPLLCHAALEFTLQYLRVSVYLYRICI